MKKVKDFQVIVDLTIQVLGWSCSIPTIRLKDVQRGTYSPTTNNITLPSWLHNFPEVFQIYYCVHEACHRKVLNHRHEFKKLERRALAFWGIEIDYKKAYPKNLYVHGRKVYDDKKDFKKFSKKT